MTTACHDVWVSSAPGRPVSRRTVLLGAGTVGAVAVLSSVAGCSYFGSDDPPTPSVDLNPAALDPINGLIATTRLHILRWDAAIAADQADAGKLQPLRDDRQQHLDALTAEYARTNPTDPNATAGSTAAPASGSVALPGSPEAIVSAVRGDAATAQVQFTDAISTASRYRAALYGTIAASLASHRAVLV
jgi:hypothetical protein